MGFVPGAIEADGNPFRVAVFAPGMICMRVRPSSSWDVHWFFFLRCCLFDLVLVFGHGPCRHVRGKIVVVVHRGLQVREERPGGLVETPRSPKTMGRGLQYGTMDTMTYAALPPWAPHCHWCAGGSRFIALVPPPGCALKTPFPQPGINALFV